MLTPEGKSGDKTDKVMLLSIWANTLKQESPSKPIIAAGMGKPTYPINPHTVETNLSYWHNIEHLLAYAQTHSEQEMAKAAIDYGDPRGDHDPLAIMARAMTRWYGTAIKPEHILFTVGGAGALRIIFETFNELNKGSNYRVITPFPHYTLYSDNRHQLHPIDVMRTPGYQLTAEALEESIKDAYQLAKIDHNYPKTVLLCNPSNPLGTVISEAELVKIAATLRKYPDLTLVLDEAYAEMRWEDVKIPSILTIAPDLKDRIIILRSATKAHSAAGERMAMLMTSNSDLMSALRDKNIATIGHAPRSAQMAYACTMDKFASSDEKKLKDFYKPKVDYVYRRLKEMGAAMPDPQYTVTSTFYVLADFSEMLGAKIPESARRALGEKRTLIKSSEDLAYYLLFHESVMVAPSQYFGLPEKNGFLRITCSAPQEELRELMDRLECCLLTRRQTIHDKLTTSIKSLLTQLKEKSPTKFEEYQAEVKKLRLMPTTCIEISKQISDLKMLSSDLRVFINQQDPEGKKRASKTILSFFRKHKAETAEKKAQKEMALQWKAFVASQVEGDDKLLRNILINIPQEQRNHYKPWIDYLESTKQEQSSESAYISTSDGNSSDSFA